MKNSCQERKWVLEGIVFYLFFAAITLASFWRLLRLPFAFDDLSVLQYIGYYRSQRFGFVDLLFLTHNEHLIPLVRLLFMGSTGLWGFDATGLRVVACLGHAFGAWVVSRLVLLSSGSRPAALLGGSLYSIASACAGSPVWVLTALNFILPAVALQAGLLAIVRWAGTGIKGPVVACSAMLFAAGTMGFSVIPALMLVPAVLFWGPGKRSHRGLFAALITLASVVVVLFGRWDYAHYAHRPFPSTAISLRGFEIFGWFALSPLGRLPWSMLPVLKLSYTVLTILTIIVGVFLGFTWKRLSPETRKLVAVSWLAHLLLAVAISMGRSTDDATEILSADRYAYYALAPLCLHLAVVYAALEKYCPARHRILRGIATCLILLGFFGNQMHLDAVVPWQVFKDTAIATAQARSLAQFMAKEARENSLELTDKFIPLANIHEGGMWMSTLFFTEFPQGNPNVHFLRTVTELEMKREDDLLASWTQTSDTTSPTEVPAGSHSP